jgi:hypothetical protein
MLYKSVRDSAYIDAEGTEEVVDKLVLMGFHVQVIDA